MKIMIQTLAIALVLGSAGAASAAYAPAHHKHRTLDYNAMSQPAPRAAAPGFGSWNVPDTGDTNATATGGPVGGLGS